MATVIETRPGMFVVRDSDGFRLFISNNRPDAQAFRDAYDATGDILESKRAVVRSWGKPRPW